MIHTRVHISYRVIMHGSRTHSHLQCSSSGHTMLDRALFRGLSWDVFMICWLTGIKNILIRWTIVFVLTHSDATVKWQLLTVDHELCQRGMARPVRLGASQLHTWCLTHMHMLNASCLHPGASALFVQFSTEADTACPAPKIFTFCAESIKSIQNKLDERCH